jgi:hypothetical protein
MTRAMLWRRGAAFGVGLTALVTIGLGVGAGSASAVPTAHAARSMNLSESASLHLVRKSGSVLYESGTATGTLSGRVTARFVTSITKVTGSVTIYPRGGGSLTINVLGFPRSAGIVARFTGTMAVRRGTGRYARALGSGSFSGTVNRRTWASTVQASARLTY